MPAFDPVRDAVLNSPVERSRRATNLSVLLNPQDSLDHAEPIRRAPPPVVDMNNVSIPYNPRRISPAGAILVPLSSSEMEAFKNYRGQGAARLMKRKREASPVLDDRPHKRHAGDVGVVVDHYNKRRDVGVEERSVSPIIGLKNFNNWVKSVLITRYAHPVLAKSNLTVNAGRGKLQGKVLDMGCGKGGDLTKWSKARVKEVLCVDIAAVSVDQAQARWQGMRGQRFDAHFSAIDCYVNSLDRAFTPAQLSQPFDVVSMQFCMHYAFESLAKVRCMLDNVTRYLRKGGVFVGTIPNSEYLYERLDNEPPDSLEFGNDIYRIKFENRDKKLYGHKYWFFLQDAVEWVPEYVVRWDSFVALAQEYNLYPIYRQDFHHVFQENQDHPEFKPLMIRMKVMDNDGHSTIDEQQWEASGIYHAFAFEKR